MTISFDMVDTFKHDLIFLEIHTWCCHCIQTPGIFLLLMDCYHHSQQRSLVDASLLKAQRENSEFYSCNKVTSSNKIYQLSYLEKSLINQIFTLMNSSSGNYT